MKYKKTCTICGSITSNNGFTCDDCKIKSYKKKIEEMEDDAEFGRAIKYAIKGISQGDFDFDWYIDHNKQELYVKVWRTKKQLFIDWYREQSEILELEKK
jgi:hypothetical protein